MAKMFYSLEETAQRLKKSPDEVRQMASRGELAEFRDGDRLIFKVDQVDVLAGDDEHASDMSSMIPLADTGAGTALGSIGLADSSIGSIGGSIGGSRLQQESPKEKSGIPVFDADELELADPSAVTQVTETAIEPSSLQVESLGSGSGLMDLTRESDDTSLGAQGLLDELYPSDEASAGATAAATGGLFEGQAAPTDLADAEAPAVAVGPVEIYDGAGSGLGGGLALGALAALVLALVVVTMGLAGQTLPFLASVGGEMAPAIWAGILAGATLLFAGVGFVMGKKSAG
ncbi:MAG: helix-turn-helix domain-containing protein [Planctomycetota bacterium]|nr:helix-turn-helix domain-containing protein [Planctomycetota bacterium]